MIWERSGNTYYAAIQGADAAIAFYLIVEPIPSGEWDWTAWRPGDDMAAHGVAQTVQDAMKQAETFAAA